MSWPHGKYPDEDLDPGRRRFLAGSIRGLGAGFAVNAFGGFRLPEALRLGEVASTAPKFHVDPRYRSARPLDALLAKAKAENDNFPSEKLADEIDRILKAFTSSLQESPRDPRPMRALLASDFKGGSLRPIASKPVRSDAILKVTTHAFDRSLTQTAAEFVGEWLEMLRAYDRVITAECQIVELEVHTSAQGGIDSISTRLRYEIVSTARGFYREQRIGEWEINWLPGDNQRKYLVQSWLTSHESQSSTTSQSFVDIAGAALGGIPSYKAQLAHGADYWRSTLDAASGIDIYGHNGISIGDLDNDGRDDLYICQAAGLPNLVYRNRGDGTFEDITASSGLGNLENTACALIVDVNNDGLQDVIVVCASGPQLYINEGSGKFRKQVNAFHFAQPPQGTFTGAAAADYDRDGWLDVYLCLYVYYQGAEQYKYPLPYYDAENGPPNFLFRNNRDGTFRDVTKEAGLEVGNTRYSFCCGWSDYDRDGWPDLYVVNDFGRKNLYHNNGDGTFSDVSKQARVEDTGAGMSVCWVDYDDDGADDLYVANMWTAAGTRIAMQPEFQAQVSDAVHALYRKHAMGNSLLRNLRDGSFSDETSNAGVGMGRWSWSSDAWDFDHDGRADIYVTNGMVSGPSRDDLNSFFWRQVIAKSPSDAKPTPAYEQGWNAINELIRADGTWSGYERNVFFANTGEETFLDVSGALGLDFLEDGRSFGLADIDGDGRLEVFLKNRNAPQLRVLKNVIPTLPASIAFRLRGVRSNRDAIGATITIHTESAEQRRSLQAGSGFLAQHSKEVLFGLGTSKGPVRASITWPSGLVQDFLNLPPNHRILIEEGSANTQIEPFAPASEQNGLATQPSHDVIPDDIETWLLAPLAAPDFALSDTNGNAHRLSQNRGRPLLLHFFTSQDPTSRRILEQINHFALERLAVDVNEASAANRRIDLGFLVLNGTAEVAAMYNILFSYLFDRHRDLPLPTSFLLNENLEIEKVYQGALNADRVERDMRSIPRNVSERIARALPFSGVIEDAEFRRNYLSYGSIFYQRGYFEQAETAFTRAFSDDPGSAEALYGRGSARLQLGRSEEARQDFERASQATASYPDTLANVWNNLGLLATREGQLPEAIDCFNKALTISPDHLVALDNLGNAYRLTKRLTDAQRTFERAVQVGPEDPDAHYGLALVYAQTGDNRAAYQEFQRTLAVRPDYPEAMNNLGILFLHMNRPDDAVQTFQRCIRTAPDFDQAYLNLAKVYALQEKRSDARAVLQQLLSRRPSHEQARELLEQLPQ